MGFTEKQRLILSTAWKQGHLSDNKNYGTISEVTGLTRKQISNWARTKINKLGNKPRPKNDNTPLSSIFFELPIEMRTSWDYSTLLAAEVVPKISLIRRNLDTTRTKARFSSQQRKVLLTAWNKGFLRDHKNYGALSEIAGLSRKQISNWATAKIKRSSVEDLPQKNLAPLSTIFKELIEGMQDGCMSNPPTSVMNRSLQNIKQESQLLKGMSPPGELLPSSISSHQHSLHSVAASLPSYSCLTPDLTQPIVSDCVQNHTLMCSSSMKSELSSDISFIPPSACCQEFTVPDETNQRSSKLSKSSSTSLISPVNEWIIQNTLKNIDEVDDEKLEVLAILSDTSYNDISQYLLQHGWNPIPAATGIRYVRTFCKEVLSQSF